MSDDLERRLVAVEERLSFAERTVEDLSTVVATQARDIQTLQEKITLLTKRLEATEAWQPSPQDDKPPPHY
jgi:SlyX protein